VAGVASIRARRLVVLAGIMAMVAAGCSSSGEDVPSGATLIVASSEPKGFNFNSTEHSSAATNDIVQNLHFYAFKADPGYGKTFPGLEGPPKLLSTSPQVVEWTIKKQAAWSDGTPVTSDDLIYFRSQLLAEGSDAIEHAGYDQMTAVAAVDDKTVRATLDPPFADYESLWTAVPQAAFLRAHPGPDPSKPAFNTALNDEPGPSAGPFEFGEWKRGESITLVRNEAWWGDPQPTVESIVFRFIPEGAAQVQALANGEVDLITPAADLDLVQQVENLAATHDVRYATAFGPTWDLLTFNLRTPALADVRVRQAIAFALDRNAMADAVMRPIAADARQLDSFIYMSNQPEYRAKAAQYHSRDLAAARRVLDEAGWVPGSDGVRAKGDQRLSLRISPITDVARFEAAAELATAQLKEVGIELQSDGCPFECMFERLELGDFDILSAGWNGTTFPVGVISHIFTTGGEQNYGKFSSPAFDDLIAQAASVANADEQAALANRADEVLWDELPGIPLYQAPSLMAVSNRFVGPAMNANGDGVFWNSNTWGPEG
jgi:peptide/nickel transport system substrate-binding protein